MFEKDMFLFKDNLTLWNGTKLILEIEHRYKDTGTILVHFDDGVDSYTENFVLEDLTEFRDKINEVISKCKGNKESTQDFTIEELKVIKGLLSIEGYSKFENPTYKSIIDKLNNKIK